MDGSRGRGLLHLHGRELDVLAHVGRGGAARTAAGLYPGLDELLVRVRVRVSVSVRVTLTLTLTLTCCCAMASTVSMLAWSGRWLGLGLG